jgi:hypothetical protein
MENGIIQLNLMKKSKFTYVILLQLLRRLLGVPGYSSYVAIPIDPNLYVNFDITIRIYPKPPYPSRDEDKNPGSISRWSLAASE